MEEMIGDTMDMMDDDDIEEAADEEVNKVLFQITDGKMRDQDSWFLSKYLYHVVGMLGEAGSVGPALDTNPVMDDEEEEEEEEEPELDLMQKRLQVKEKVKMLYLVAFC
jgi:charged multivesicular body protein 3